MEPLLVYFSSKSLNTHKFVCDLNINAQRIPLSKNEPFPQIDKPYILVTPTYGGDNGQGAVPKQVIRFLNKKNNRYLILGVIASGNKNFGKYYGFAGDVISQKCNIPLLYKFELRGTKSDRVKVEEGVTRIWQQLL